MKSGLTILVFAYNEEKYIVTTIKLILDCIKRTKLKYEIIVLNDGSTDNTKYIVKKISSKIKI